MLLNYYFFSSVSVYLTEQATSLSSDGKQYILINFLLYHKLLNKLPF